MALDDLIRRLEHRTDQRYVKLLPGLGLARSTAPYGMDASVYEPLVCLILQGQKETTVGSACRAVSAGEAIVVSHALPVFARVTRASPEAPYLALVAPIDLSLLRSLDLEIGEDRGQMGPASSFLVHRLDEPTVAVLERYVDLADDPTDARVLAPLLRRELHYRLLRATSGGMLRALTERSTHASNIAQAIRLLRDRFRERLQMEEVASEVGMSPSSFYKHFKDVTSTTPLQYQKDLRLTEARRLLLGGDAVSTAAYTVGYESPSQFSREYSRRFGVPPGAERSATA